MPEPTTTWRPDPFLVEHIVAEVPGVTPNQVAAVLRAQRSLAAGYDVRSRHVDGENGHTAGICDQCLERYEQRVKDDGRGSDDA